MPFLKSGVMPRTMLDIVIDANSIATDYYKFGQIHNVVLYIDLKMTHVVGLVDNKLIVRINFKKFNALPIKYTIDDVIQISKVAILPEYEGQGIVSSIYSMLVSQGFTTVADSTQFAPAKLLWKKLAKTSSSVYVVTTRGNITKYTGSNIPDDTIWSSGLDQSGYGKMLIMTTAQL